MAQASGPDAPALMFRPACDYTRQTLTQLCEPVEALVLSSDTGPTDQNRHHVALVRTFPPETRLDVQWRRQEHIAAHHAVLVEFKFISGPYGVIDWSTVHVAGGHVLVKTMHFLASDAHFAPSVPGTLEIDVVHGGIELINLPDEDPEPRAPSREGALHATVPGRGQGPASPVPGSASPAPPR